MRRSTLTNTLGLGLSLALLAAASATTIDENEAARSMKKNHPAIALPAAIEFGTTRPADVVQGRIWLINRSDETLRLTKAIGNCGCINLRGFEPGELAPHSALPVDFTYAAPKKDGEAKTKSLTFLFDDQEALTVAMSIAAADDAEAQVEHEGSIPDMTGVITAPGQISFGEVEANRQLKSDVWLINTSEQPQTVTSAKGDCGCITFREFEPITLQPNEARRVSFRIKTPDKAGQVKNTAITFLINDHDPLILPLSLRSGEDRIATTK